jgi:3-dehydroquinate dehydratase/shikimate dehydrogenase
MTPTNHPEKTLLIVPTTRPSAAGMRADMVAAKAAGADMVECRLDFLESHPDSETLGDLLTDAPLPILVTCRPTRQGGRYDGDERARLAILAETAKFDSVEAVDVEADVPPDDRPADVKIILSHHDFAGCPPDLEDIATEMDHSSAAVNKVAFLAAGPEDALRALDVIRSSRKPTMALSMGATGLAGRVLAKKFDAYGTFAALEPGTESAAGQPTIAEMKNLYRWETLDAATEVYGAIGCPIAHSMSPAIHNAAFAATGRNAVYLPLRIEPGKDPFFRFMDAAVARPWLGLRGLSVTIPHKENALAYVGAENCDPLAVKIGAVNTITISPDGILRGDNTDYAGAIDALCNAMSIAPEALAGRGVAVLGAGGVARAIIAALAHYQAEVTVYNRTVSRAEALAEEFGCRAAGLDELKKIDAEIVINCTSLGMAPKIDASPLEEIPAGVKVVFDTIYNPIETRLLAMAQPACATVSGVEMFINQAVGQFEIWTGQPAPRQIMQQVVLDRLRPAGPGSDSFSP